MHSRLKIGSVLVVLLSLLFVAVGAQDPQSAEEPEGDEGFRIGVAVDQVFLSVNARSVSGGFVRNLDKDDFRVFENGAPQEIVNFYSERVPVHVVLLIDASESTRVSQSEIKRAALEFARSLGKEDQVAIITFNHQPRLILNWTSELEKVELALESIYPKGRTVLNDAIYVTADDLLQEVDGKKAVILLTDGVDTGSMVSFEEARELTLRSEAIVYVVSKLKEYWAGASAWRIQLQAQMRPVPRELTDEYILQVRKSLQELAQSTGGKVLETEAFQSLTDVYGQVAEELKNQYYLSYIPSDRRKDGSWRTVDIQVPYRPDVVVRTRKGYFADEGSQSAN